MIRTCDLLIRSQALYPAELRVHKSEYLDYKCWAFLSSAKFQVKTIRLGILKLEASTYLAK